jgi:hypothetical protein
MKQYVVDELRSDDHKKLKEYLDANFAVPGFAGLYWLPLEERVLADVQKSHLDCKPYYFALELTSERLACEMLVRTNNRVRCDCIQYATDSQRNWLMQSVDSIFERLKIIT